MIELTSEAAYELVAACMFPGGECNGNRGKGVTVPMIMATYRFDPDRVEANKPLVRELLAQLPVQFRPAPVGGGGWSFMNACLREDGTQWTGEHRVMEGLFAVGMAAGFVSCPIGRDLWAALPGGMPYYIVEVDGDA
jgi:hypothetical protein